jgi:hypothetical protein
MKKLLQFFGLATNQANHPLAIGTAVNVEAIGEAEWVEFPYGETDYWQQMPDKKWRKFTQVFLKPQAQKMVTAINTVRASKGSNWRGLPIYVGHPDADAARWPDDRRLGGIMEMEAGEDRMRLKVAWNDLGEKNKEQGYYVYPSPAWLYDIKAALNTGRIVPDELRSVGLTNTPRIPDSPAWTNVDGPGSSLSEANNPVMPAGSAGPTKTNPTDNIMNHRAMLLKLLQKHHSPNLSDDATDDQIATACNSALANEPLNVSKLSVNVGDQAFELQIAGEAPATLPAQLVAVNAAASELPAVKATLGTIQTDLATATGNVTKFRDLATNSLLDAALNAGRISAAERAELVADFTADFDAAATKLAAKKKTALNMQRLELQPTGDGDLTTPHGRQLAFNAALDEYQRPVEKGGKGIRDINEAIAAMRGNPAHKAILDAMNQG